MKGESTISTKEKIVTTIIKQSCKDFIKNSITEQAFFNLYPELEFYKASKEWKCKQSGGLAIANKQDGYVLFNNSGKTKLKTGNIFTQVVNKHNLKPRNNQVDYLKMWEVLSQITNIPLEFEEETQEDRAERIARWKKEKSKRKPKKTKVHIEPPYKANDSGQDYVQSLTPIYADENAPVTDGTIIYLRKKINAPNFSLKDLPRFNIKPVAKTINSNEKEFIFNQKNIAFATLSGENDQNVKIKIPYNRNKNYRNIYAANKGNRLYLYSNLPPRRKNDQEPHKETVCIIAAGETDAIAINYHYNQFGIYAVCLGGENNTIPKGLIKELKLRVDHVLTCFDNDKTGKKTARKARKIGVPSIKLWKYTDNPELNDICDFIQKLGPEKLIEILQLEIYTRHSILKIPNNPFSVSVTDCYKIGIDKYVSENKLTYLKEILTKEKKILLQAPTGTGKTTAFLKLAFDEKFRKRIDVQRIIIFVPTTSIGTQIREKIRQDYGFYPTFFEAGISANDVQQRDDILICTYQGCSKVSHLLEDALIVIDESHTLIDWAFNGRHNRQILEFAEIATKTVLISATPNLKLTIDIPLLNYKFCKVIQNNKYAQKIKMFPLTYQGKPNTLLKTILEKKHKNSNTVVVKKDNVELLETFRDTLTENKITNSKGNPYNFEIFSSRKKEYKQDNENYNHLMKHSWFKSPVDFCCVTSLFDFGINMNPKILQYFLLDEVSINSCIQMPGRSRINYKTGKNSLINVYVIKKEISEEVKKYEKKQERHTTEVVFGIYSNWKNIAESANTHNKDEDQDDLLTFHKSGIQPIYKSKITGKYEVNTLGILEMEQIREDDYYRKNPEMFYKTIEQNFENVEMMPPEEIIEQDDSINHSSEILLNKRKLTRKKEELEAYYMLTKAEKEGYLEETIEAVYHSTGDKKLKRDIKSKITIKKELSIEAIELGEGNPHFKNGRFNIHLGRYFMLRKLSIDTDKILPILEKFSKQQTNTAFKEFCNSLICGIEIEVFKNYSHKLSGETIERVRKYHQIIDKFDTLQHKEVLIGQIYGRMKDIIGEDRYAKMNSYVKPLRELYDVKTNKKYHYPNGKDIEACKTTQREEYDRLKKIRDEQRLKRNHYTISKKNPFALLEQHGIDKDEYLNQVMRNNIKIHFDKKGI